MSVIGSQPASISGGSPEPPKEITVASVPSGSRKTTRWFKKLRPLDIINALVGIAMFLVALAALFVAMNDSVIQEAVRKLGEVSHDLDLQAKSAATQVETMQKQLNAMNSGERAWIGKPQIVKIVSGDEIAFKVVFKNSGKSPTNGLYAGARIVDSPDPRPPVWKVEAEKFCEKGKQEFKNDPDWFHTFSITPNDDAVLNDDQIDGFLEITPAVREYKGPHLAGCVVYRSAFDPELHQTIFVAPLKRESGFDVDAVYTVGAN
jgi:hypothetical protein